jgi:hypothetical protein
VSGVIGTSSVGTVAPNLTEFVNGVSATGSVGTIQPNIITDVSGVSATSALGTTQHNVVVIPTGVEATSALGEVFVTYVIDTFVGVEGTSSVGDVTVNVIHLLTTNALTLTVGTPTIDAVQFDYDAFKTVYSRKRCVYIPRVA